MTKRILEILNNTATAIRESKESGDEGRFAFHNYVKGFVRFDGAKNRGSFIRELTEYDETIDFLAGLTWTEMTQEEAVQDGDATADTTNSQYFRGTVPEKYTGFVGGMLYGELPEDLKNYVEEVDGLHGPELQLNHLNIDGLVQTKEIRLIVSRSTHPYNATGMDVLATWFPGTLAPPFDKSENLDERFVKMFV